MIGKDNLRNRRLERIITHYRRIHSYQRSGYKGIMKANSLKSLIRLTKKDMVNCDMNGHETKSIDNNNVFLLTMKAW